MKETQEISNLTSFLQLQVHVLFQRHLNKVVSWNGLPVWASSFRWRVTVSDICLLVWPFMKSAFCLGCTEDSFTACTNKIVGEGRTYRLHGSLSNCHQPCATLVLWTDYRVAIH